MAKSSRFQFGISRLIALTSAVAVVMAISIRIDAPRFAQWIFAAYLVMFVGWAVMRGPNMYAKLRDAFVLGSLEQLRYNTYFGDASKNLIETTVTELGAGDSEQVIEHLK